MKKQKIKIANKFLYFTGASVLLLAFFGGLFLETVSIQNPIDPNFRSDRNVASISSANQNSLYRTVSLGFAQGTAAIRPDSTKDNLTRDEAGNFEDGEQSGGVDNSRESLSALAVKGMSRKNIVEFDINCGAKRNIIDQEIQKQAAIDSSFLRLTGKRCLRKSGSISSDGELTITNTTNGFTATVFSKNNSGNEYQTDLIQLSEGENIILVSYQADDGHRKSDKISVQSLAVPPNVQ